MKTAEQFFKETIAEYNKNATPMNVFSFSKKESEMFIDMIEEYARQCCDEQIKQISENPNLSLTYNIEARKSKISSNNKLNVLLNHLNRNIHP